MNGRDAPRSARLRLTVDGADQRVLDLEAPSAAARPADAAPGPETTVAADRTVVDQVSYLARLGGPASPGGGSTRYEVIVDGWRFEVEVESAARADLRERASHAAQRGLGSGRQVVRAQIPGRIVALAVAEGAVVEAGQRLLSVEAMKMENAVIAPWAGTIARIGVVAGQTVERGDELVVIE